MKNTNSYRVHIKSQSNVLDFWRLPTPILKKNISKISLNFKSLKKKTWVSLKKLLKAHRKLSIMRIFRKIDRKTKNFESVTSTMRRKMPISERKLNNTKNNKFWAQLKEMSFKESKTIICVIWSTLKLKAKYLTSNKEQTASILILHSSNKKFKKKIGQLDSWKAKTANLRWN
jgi:predicted DNA-binding ribbon-helix-helix protein